MPVLFILSPSEAAKEQTGRDAGCLRDERTNFTSVLTVLGAEKEEAARE